MDLDEAKRRVIAEIDGQADLLLDVSHQIHAHPELGYEEVFAHDLLTRVIAEQGLDVEPHAYGVPTAFAARAGTAGPTMAVCCEYDALPGIGHACGHNIIAAAGLGAGLAVAQIADEAGGRVVILGTPAEEGGGGKVRLIDAGAFSDVDAALMVHPAGGNLSSMNVIAVHRVLVTYHGQAAHAAAYPYKGRNALDAAVLGYVNAAALRQHIRPEERIHGIFTEAGDKPNIVPARAAAEWYVRAANVARLDQLRPRLVACLQAGADAAGCTVEYDWQEPVYADMRDNGPMVELYSANAGALGRRMAPPDDAFSVVGSTDMGNVSYEVPSIHPMIAVSPPHVSIHTPEFADYAVEAPGDAAVLDGAKALAMTMVDLWLKPGALAEVTAAFEPSAAVQG
jgi:amidohydrolase